MGKGRLEAFSDGVLAIIITIMVLELRAPHGEDLTALAPLTPVFLSYVLSFIYIAIYWNNHHHMLHAAHQVNGRILWSNTHLLFWLSLVPFATAWMGENHFAPRTVAVYGSVLCMAGIAYYILARALAHHHGDDSELAQALGNDVKGKVSIVLYLIGIALSFANQWLALTFYVAVAVMWLIPDTRFEKDT
ncbi:MAG: TMEM175 family protein [Vicinamibacterales bacterium]